MRSERQFTVVDAHSAGAQARVVVGGVPAVPGATIRDKRAFLRQNRDDIRKLLMYEPRGGAQMSGSIILPPCDPRADVGIVFIESGGWLTMCGAGTIGAATVLIETGMVPKSEPLTTVMFDTPAGLVTASVEVRDGAVQGVGLENVPSFLAVADHRVDLDGFGPVSVDVSYGGNFYIMAAARDFGLEIVPAAAERLVAVGRELRRRVNESLTVTHPLEAEPQPIPNVVFTQAAAAGSDRHRNMVLFGEAGVDRSPGGTGTSARMAQRFARGELGLDEPFRHESIIGSVFEGRLLRVETLGPYEAVVPTIRGRAFITGLSTFVLDPADSFPEGFGVGYAADARPKGRG